MKLDTVNLQKPTLTLEAGESVRVIVNTTLGRREFDLMTSGAVVIFGEDATMNSILFRPSGAQALLGGSLFTERSVAIQTV